MNENKNINIAQIWVCHNKLDSISLCICWISHKKTILNKIKLVKKESIREKFKKVILISSEIAFPFAE